MIVVVVVVKERILRRTTLIVEGVRNEPTRRKIGIKGGKIDDMLKSFFNHSSFQLRHILYAKTFFIVSVFK